MLAVTSKFPGKWKLAAQRSPLLWALPLQALLLLTNLNLLDPWGDESSTLAIVPRPLSEVVSSDPMHPPLYYAVLHYWIQLPWTETPLTSMRAMSAMWALLATVVIYVFYLRREVPRLQAMFLALWVLSPSLLLHARMARSYSMQLALSLLAIYTAQRWAEEPRDWKRFFGYAGSSGALLYTHYLSGFAIAAGVCVALLLKRKLKLVVAHITLLAILYLPWGLNFGSALGRWIGTSYPYEGGNVISDQFVRLAYLFVSLSFGETVSIVTILLSIVLGPILIYALWQSRLSRPAWLPIVVVATGVAWIGVSRFEQFVFMPNHLLFILPFFLILILRQLNPLAFAALLVLYVCADYAYFARSGFLVKPYAAPYKEMADVIRDGSRGQNALVAVDRHGPWSEPLVHHLGGTVRVIFLDNEASARKVLEAARSGPSGPSPIWLWRRSRDVSPGAFVTKLERELSASREGRRREFVLYSLPERLARRLLRGPGQPSYYYSLYDFRLARDVVGLRH